MHLYSLSLVKGGAIVNAVYGNFSGTNKAHEVAVNHGTRLELLRVDSAQAVLKTLCCTEAFGVIRSISALRTSGSKKDLLVVGTDAGRMCVLEFNTDIGDFVRVQCDTFGKSGCRRIVPGQYVCADPAGRAIMVCAVEMQKFVYAVGRDSNEKLTIDSPLEAHKQHMIVFDCCAMDVGFENPLFASLELDYSPADNCEVESPAALEKSLVFYELDLGLNHVVRKEVQKTVRSGNLLIPLPGGESEPGGVFVCGEGIIQYHTPTPNGEKSTEPISLSIPKRADMPADRQVLLVSFGMNYRRTKDKTILFFIVQSDLGDLYKIEVDITDNRLTAFHIKYFDTAPVGKSLCITKRGYLFIASEFGDHSLYKFEKVGDSDDKTVQTSSSDTADVEIPIFAPRANRNISHRDTIRSLAPCTGLAVAELCGEERNQIYTICGQGSRSTLRVLRHGLEVSEIVTELPGTPSAVWTVHSSESENDKYIVVSFVNVSMVLSVGETIEEATDSGLLTDYQTLAVEMLGDGSMLQVCTNGIHLTKEGKEGWKVPGHKKIDCAVTNPRQIAIAVEGGNIYYFEFDESGGLECKEVFDLGEDVKCLDLGKVPKGRVRSPFLAVGTFSNSIQVLSLDPENRMKECCAQALPDQAASLCIIDMPYTEAGTKGSGATSLTLCAGLRNGVLVRTRLDESTGTIIDSRTQFLGHAAPVICSPIRLPFEQPSHEDSEGEEQDERKQNALLALCGRPWVVYSIHGGARVMPLSYETLTHASNFQSEICDGVVAVAGNSLRILSIEDLSQTFNQKSIKLSYTPRKLLIHDGHAVIVEGDHNVQNEKEREDNSVKMKELHDKQYPDQVENGDAMQLDDDDEDQPAKLTIEQTGLPKAGAGNQGRWASAVRIVNPGSGETTSLFSLESNEMGISAAIVPLRDNEKFLVVGTVKELTLHPQKHKEGYLRVFRMTRGSRGLELQLVASTKVKDGAPRAICGIAGLPVAVVGVGNTVRIYRLGNKELLRKSELKCMPTAVTFLCSYGNRIYAGDAHESVHLLRYSPSDNSLVSFADDTIPRLCTTGAVLDFDTVAGADKFGNLFVLRLPSEVGDCDIDNPTGTRILWDQAKLSGAPNKLDQLVQYHTGEVITSLQKTELVTGRAQALIYTTIMGSIGAFVPFASKNDVEFFSLLEMHLRAQQQVETIGREHLSYRSYFSPVKNCVDGDLCEQFAKLPLETQEKIASQLERTPAEVSKKIEDLRNSLL